MSIRDIDPEYNLDGFKVPITGNLIKKEVTPHNWNTVFFSECTVSFQPKYQQVSECSRGHIILAFSRAHLSGFSAEIRINYAIFGMLTWLCSPTVAVAPESPPPSAKQIIAAWENRQESTTAERYNASPVIIPRGSIRQRVGSIESVATATVESHQTTDATTKNPTVNNRTTTNVVDTNCNDPCATSSSPPTQQSVKGPAGNDWKVPSVWRSSLDRTLHPR